MAAKVRIPTPLQKLTNNQGDIFCDGATIDQILNDLEAKHPGVKERLCDEKGKLRRFVNVYVNEEDIRFLQGQETALKTGDDISIIPAIAGGATPPFQSGEKPGRKGGAKKRVTLVFPQDLIQEPVVFNMAKKFDIIPNIRKARVTETVGEMVRELEGTTDDLDKGIQYLKKTGGDVRPVVSDIIE